MTGTALFTYGGSKANLVDWILGQMPAHDTYVEPFAGSLSVLLAKRRCETEVVNDLDDNLVNFFRVLRDRPDDLIRVCELTPAARSEWEYAKDVLSLDIESDDLERARLWWLFQMASVNGSGRGLSMRAGSRKAVFLDRFRTVARRLSRVVIESKSALDLMPTLDGPGVVFYCDPPYVGSERDPGIYRVEMRDDDLHRDFAAVCRDLKGRVLISGYPSDLYEAEFTERGWHRMERKVVSTLSSANRIGNDIKSVDAVEVLWANFPLREQGRLW